MCVCVCACVCDRISILREGCRKSGRVTFLIKMLLSVITKDLNWEILIKNLVTFKRWDEVKDEKLPQYTPTRFNVVQY